MLERITDLACCNGLMSPGLSLAQRAQLVEQAIASEISSVKRDAAMYKASFETANAENKRLSVKVATLQKQVDEKDELAAKIQSALERELANAEFEIGRMANHPLMRFVRWAKGWE